MKFESLVVAGVFLIVSSSAADESKSDVYQTDEIVITATKTEKIISDVSQDVSVVTGKEIERSNAQTVGDVLKYIPGLNLSNSDDIPGESTYQTTLRGLRIDDGYVLFLIDGQRVKGRGMGEYGNGLNQLPVEMIERIEVVKGSSSVLYGSDAVAGVINIITKPASKKESLGAYANYGSRNISREGFNYANTIGKIGFRTSAAMERANIDEYDSRYFNNRLTYNHGRGSYKFDVNVNDINSGTSVERRVSLAPDVTIDLGNASKLNIKTYWYDWDFTQSSRYGNIYWDQAEIQYTKIIGTAHSLAAGAEFLRQGMDYDFKGAVVDSVQQWPHLDKNVDNISVYAQDEWSVNDKARISLGARYDNHTEYDGVFSPRISGLYDITETARLRASVGRSFKSPTIRQIYYPGFFKHGSFYIVSNPDLKPEYSTGYTLSLEKSFGKKFWASLVAYRNDLTDMVQRYDTGETYDGIKIEAYKNVSDACTQGLEGEFRFQVMRGFSGTLTAALTDAKNKDTDKKLTSIPEHTEGLQLNYFNSRFGAGIDWGLIYYGECYTDDDNTKKKDGYFLAEVKIRKDVTKRVSLTVECDNVFDSDYGVESSSQVPRMYSVKLNLNQQ